MLRRLRLPARLFVAGIPLVLTLVTATGFLVADTLAESADVARASELARAWEPITDIVAAVTAEEEAALAGASGTDARSRTDAAVAATRDAVTRAGKPIPLVRQLGVAVATLSAVRGTVPVAEQGEITDGFASVRERFLEIGALMSSEVSDEAIARDLAAVSAMARAGESAAVEEAAALQAARTGEGAALDLVRVSEAELAGWLATFEASASGDLLDAYRTSGVPSAMSEADRALRLVLRSESTSVSVGELANLLAARDAAFADTHAVLVERIASSASATATRAEREAWTVVAVAGAALLLGTLATVALARSVVRRIRSLTERASEVAEVQLPALVEAIRDPRGGSSLPGLPPIGDVGGDEIGELARSFGSLQTALSEVAAEQVRVLRKGVSDMFVSLARRNRSLIDRQLSLIDELESDEDDPALLAELYRLDHLATRMRRNAESLLVMAGVSSPRAPGAGVEVDDVVRAAIGEVEDFRRVDVLALESVRISGSAVADLSHLLAELVENAVSFSPPETRVRVTGHFHQGGYLVTISDRGVGIAPERLNGLNALLATPPVVGLALDPTLGLFVVSVLAQRHGVTVTLVPGAPGLSANIVIPGAVFDVSSDPSPRHLAAVGGPARRDAEGGDGRRATSATSSATAIATPASSARPAAGAPGLAAPGHGQPPASAAGLPTRSPGSSFVVERDRLMPSPGEIGVASEAGSLPVRSPGVSFSADAGGQSVSSGASPREPEQIRSALSSFQSGKDAGRQPDSRPVPDDEGRQ